MIIMFHVEQMICVSMIAINTNSLREYMNVSQQLGIKIEYLIVVFIQMDYSLVRYTILIITKQKFSIVTT